MALLTPMHSHFLCISPFLLSLFHIHICLRLAKKKNKTVISWPSSFVLIFFLLSEFYSFQFIVFLLFFLVEFNFLLLQTILFFIKKKLNSHFPPHFK